MEKPSISIIIPCYGVEKYLNRCMESVVHQSLKDIEIILVDDKSIDRTPELCEEWRAKDSRIQVIHKSVNEGLGLARNTGLNIAKGDYVAFVDSDDYVDVQMFAQLYDFALQFGLDVAYCGFNRVENGNVIETRLETASRVVYDTNEGCRNVLKGMLSSKDRRRITDYEMSVWHAIYKRRTIVDNKICFPSERELVSEDILFHIDFLSVSNGIGFIPYALYNYCLNPSSLTTVYREDRFEKICVLYETILNRVQEKGNDWHEKDLCKFFALYVRFVISNCVKHIDDMGEEKCISLIESYAQNHYVVKWIFPYIWSFPVRYKIFYLFLKLGLYKWIVKMVKIKT